MPLRVGINGKYIPQQHSLLNAPPRYTSLHSVPSPPPASSHASRPPSLSLALFPPLSLSLPPRAPPGYGRIGRLVLRAAQSNPNIQIVAVNDPFVPLDYMSYMTKYDSTHGQLDAAVEYGNGSITIDGEEIKVFNEMSPADIPWASAGADYVGAFLNLYIKGIMTTLFAYFTSKTNNMILCHHSFLTIFDSRGDGRVPHSRGSAGSP